MATLNIHEAKTQFSRLVDQAEAGEEIVIARAGKPVARLIGLAATKATRSRKLGLGKKKFTFPENFDNEAADQIAVMFEHGK
jgi:prevent-host-death family protein